MDEQVADILETCLQRIGAGASVEDCLLVYPQQRAALEAPLHAAAQLGALPRPALPAATRAALEARVLAFAAQRRAAEVVAVHAPLPPPAARGAAALGAFFASVSRALGYHGTFASPWPRLAAGAIALVLALALASGVYAAARVIVRVVQAPATRQNTPLPAAAPFALDGPIEQIAPGRWRVNGRDVMLDAQTAIRGTPAVGALAQIRGDLQADATLLARTITVGPPSSLPHATPPARPAAPAAGPADAEGAGKPAKPDKPPKPDKPGKPAKPPKHKAK